MKTFPDGKDDKMSSNVVLKRVNALALAALLLLCGTVLWHSMTPQTASAATTKDTTVPTTGATVTDYSVRLFQQTYSSKEDSLVSPLSTLYALDMTSQGARGATLRQMNKVLGGDKDTRRTYLSKYLKRSTKTKSLRIANGIWLNTKLGVKYKKSFINAVEKSYKAKLNKAPFNSSTKKEINNWVSKKTNKMIPNLIDSLPKASTAVLVNAMAFSAKWAEPFDKNLTKRAKFTREDGTTKYVSMMSSTEGNYINDGLAQGFMKVYENGRYGFIAMLPNEGVSLKQYVQSLTGSSVRSMIKKQQNPYRVYAKVPRFKFEYQKSLKTTLTKMGMTRAFDEDLANFRNLGTAKDGNLFISKVVHKTKISLNENGTKAAAATAVCISKATAAMDPPPSVEITLDRPFVFMIVDLKSDIPIFMGTMTGK